MTADTAFFNLYVDNLLKEITELNKSKILLMTRLAWQEKQLQDAADLQEQLDQAHEKIRILSEKKAKKTAKEDGGGEATF